jgi:DNA-3-methyladenine glycosylase I
MPASDERIVRCAWARNPLSVKYHDEEWGVPVHDDRRWFEFLVLEGAQAGLSWDTILQKRKCYRKLFSGFDPGRVARYDAAKVRTLLRDPGIVRHRLKIQSTISNARAFLQVQKEFDSFDEFIWNFVGGMAIQNRWTNLKQVPVKSELSIKLSRELLKRSFRFVGPTICYALMQATGLVNDHLVTCHRYQQLSEGNPQRSAKRR